MRRLLFAGSALGLALAAGAASAQTLNDVKARGTLKCGVNTGFAGLRVSGRRTAAGRASTWRSAAPSRRRCSATPRRSSSCP